MILFALAACGTSEPRFDIRYAHERSPLEDPLAVGAKVPVRLVARLRPEDRERPTVADAAFTTADPAVAKVEDGLLIAVSEGSTRITATGELRGQVSSATRDLRVRPSARTEWRANEAPVTGDLLVLAGTQHSFAVHHFDADGHPLIAEGIDVPVPEHASIEHGGLPGFTLVRFKSMEPGVFAVPGQPWSIEVAPGFESWSTEGATLTVRIADGRVPWIRSPGPRFESLDDGCTVRERAEGTNPFTLVQKQGPPTCRVQVTLYERTFTIDATF
ncbi:MAG: hypothetical protein H6737_24980 [Alphaproteobacteria bacterium]|nr:hypothetical protein [Alphaproteobacteria bacterium]